MINTNENHVSVHLMIEVGTAEEAHHFAETVSKRLSPHYSTSVQGIQQYWKIPEYFEAFVKAQCDDISPRNAADIANILGSRWLQIVTDYIWNDVDGAEFVCDKVRWVNVQWIEF